jgi:hypothetical protein
MFDIERRGRRSEYNSARVHEAPQPGDEQCGAFSRQQLVAMDQRFTHAIERAFKTSTERRQLAAMNGANASRLR